MSELTEAKGDLAQTGAAGFFAAMERLVEKGISPDVLRQMLEMKERYDATQAAAAYGHALTRFQAECPMVEKTNAVKNKDGSLRYMFAGYEDVMKVAQPHLSRHAIAVSFSTPATANGDYTMVCRLQVGSHFVDHPFTMKKPDVEAIAKSMYMTVPQAEGLVQSYFKRYSFCSAAGVVVCKEDNDAAGALDTLIAAEVDQLQALITEKGVDLKKFLEWAQVEELAQMPRSNFAKAISLLKQKKAGGK